MTNNAKPLTLAQARRAWAIIDGGELQDVHAQVEDFIAKVDAAHEKRKKMEAAQ